MKYLLMMTGAKAGVDDYKAWPEKDIQNHFAFLKRTNDALSESGEFVSTQGLGTPDQAKAVRAYEIAARISAGPGPGGGPLNMPIEVRQIMDRRTAEMP